MVVLKLLTAENKTQHVEEIFNKIAKQFNWTYAGLTGLI